MGMAHSFARHGLEGAGGKRVVGTAWTLSTVPVLRQASMPCTRKQYTRKNKAPHHVLLSLDTAAQLCWSWLWGCRRQVGDGHGLDALDTMVSDAVVSQPSMSCIQYLLNHNTSLLALNTATHLCMSLH